MTPRELHVRLKCADETLAVFEGQLLALDDGQREAITRALVCLAAARMNLGRAIADTDPEPSLETLLARSIASEQEKRSCADVGRGTVVPFEVK